MKKSLLLSLTLGALIFTGCNQSQESVKPMEKPTVSKPKIHQCDPLMEGPSWLRSGGDIDYGLGVIGVSSKATDTSTKIDIAQTDAYAKAAQQLKTEILGTVEMLRESHEGISKETFEKVFALDVKNIPISGLKQKVDRSDKTVEYIALVDVSPMQKSPNTKAPTTNGSEVSHIKSEKYDINPIYIQKANSHNEIAKTKESKIIDEYLNNKNSIIAQIATLQNEINSLNSVVTTLKNSYHIECNDNCVDTLKTTLSTKIQETKKQIKNNLYKKIQIVSQSQKNSFDEEAFRKQQEEALKKEQQRYEEQAKKEQETKRKAQEEYSKQKRAEQEKQRREYEQKAKEEAKKQHTGYQKEYHDGIDPELKQFYSLDPYVVLGVSRDDDFKTITKHYRKIMFKYHPDRRGEEYTEVTQFINKAYATIQKQKKDKS
jgi:hypothetical protein